MSNASGIYKRKQKHQNKSKIEHACRESDMAKKTSGPWCPHQSTKQCLEK